MSRVADATALRTATADACPGRTAALIEARVAQLLGAPGHQPADIAEAARSRHGLTDAEAALLDVVEVFVADVHAVSDDDIAGLGAHYAGADIVAMLLHAGLCDGFTKRSIVDRTRREVTP